MKASEILDTKAAAYVGVAIVGVVVAWWLLRKAGNAASAVAEAVNPVSDKNIAYRTVNQVGTAITGDSEFSLGSWFYDLTHPAYDPNAPATPKGAEPKPWWVIATTVGK